MNIRVLFQVVPDTAKAIPDDWTADPRAPLCAPLPRVIDAFDESALELALRLRNALEAQNIPVDLGGVTMGGEKGDHLIDQRLFALGFSTITRLQSSVPLYDPREKARVLAGTARGADILLCGAKSGLGGSGMTGYLVADALQIPAAANVCAIEPIDAETLRVVCVADSVRRVLRVPIPAVLIIGNAENAWLRVPTLRARMASAGQQTVSTPASVREGRLPFTVRQPFRTVPCRYLTGPPAASAEQLIDFLLATDAADANGAAAPEALPPGLCVFGAEDADMRAAAHRLQKSDAPYMAGLLCVKDGALIRMPFAGAIEAVFEPISGMVCTLDRHSPLAPTEAYDPAMCNGNIIEESYETIADSPALADAPCVLIAGYGLGSAAEVAHARLLAEKLGLAFGATRPVVMNGWAPISAQVGVSGAMLSASRCLALGVSGAGAFLAALPSHTQMAAVNLDAQAPVFRVAEIGVRCDARDILRALLDCIR